MSTRIQPLREEKQNIVLRIKDLTALTLSVLAFILSVLTIYWNILRQVDDMRVVVTGSPSLIFERKRNGVKFYLTNGNLTFLNLGNRSAAITTASLDLYRPPNDVHECGWKSGQHWLLETAAVVVKPGDVSVQSATTVKSPEDVVFPVDVQNETTLHFVVCMTFNVITPDNMAVEKTVFVGEFEVSTNPTDEDRNILQFLSGRSQILISKWGLTFF